MPEVNEESEKFEVYHIRQEDIALTFEYSRGWSIEIIDDAHLVPNIVISNPPLVHVLFRAPTVYGTTSIGVSVHKLKGAEDGDDYINRLAERILTDTREAEQFGLRQLLEDVRRKLPSGEGRLITYSSVVGRPFCVPYGTLLEREEQDNRPPKRSYNSIFDMALGRHVYTLTYHAPENEYLRYHPVFEHMLATFQVE